MFEATARNLRTVERFLLVPPLPASFASEEVAVSDISERGARFVHDAPFETGKKGALKIPLDGRPAPLTLEAVVVWSQGDPSAPARFISGARTYGAPEVIQSLIRQLQTSRRSNRIEELRSADRFFVAPAVEAVFGKTLVRIENISAKGARLEAIQELSAGATDVLRFAVPNGTVKADIKAEVRWCAMKAITGSNRKTYRIGVELQENPIVMRMAIAQLCENNRAQLDTQSLALKLKIMKARARQLAPSYQSIEASGIPAEQYLLIEGVREELRLNPEEAIHWYRRARLIINDPAVRSLAPVIADHPDALAVWEYLDRSVDPSIVGRAFSLRGH
jgi:hypothetical protein